MEKEPLLIFVCATTGDGETPDNGVTKTPLKKISDGGAIVHGGNICAGIVASIPPGRASLKLGHAAGAHTYVAAGL